MSYLTDELNQRIPPQPYDDMKRDLKNLLEKAGSVNVAGAETIRRSIAMIDATSLQDSDTYMQGGESAQQIVDLCDKAASGDVKAAAVCVYPNHVETAVGALKETDVEVAVVNNFPHGDADAREAAQQALDAIRDGASEIDTVMDYEACFNADFDTVMEKLQIVADVCHDNEAALKIILKGSVYSSYDTLYEVTQMACSVCRDGDYIKTCTGKMPKSGFGNGAADASTLPMGLTVMQAVADYNQTHDTDIRVKISGGVKNAQDCESYRMLAEEIMGPHMFTADHIRFGASSLLDNLRADLAHVPDLDLDLDSVIATQPATAAGTIKKPGK